MIPVITTEEAERLDQASQIPVDVLMDRAGRAVAAAAVRLGAGYGTRVAVLAGPGNNGGDGYVAARILKQRGASVRVHALGEPRTAPAQNAMTRARAAGVIVSNLGRPDLEDLVIDGVFGGGSRAGFPDQLKPWLETAVPVLAVDVPTGLDPNTGTVDGLAFTAARTVTFGALKVGHLIGEGPAHCGEVIVVDIGLPPPNPTLRLLEEGDLGLPRRPRQAHKWSAGSVLVVGGWQGMTGAAVIAGKAALAFGAGAVGVAVPAASLPTLAAAAPELLAYTIEELPQRYQVMVIGPGLAEDAVGWAGDVIGRHRGPMVVDAGALEAIGDLSPGSAAVITPHAGEFSRLAKAAPSYTAARELAERIEVTVLLKGNPTVVTDGGIPWAIASGGPELATIGTGDVLAGMVGALLARGMAPCDAAAAAAYWHGRAGNDLKRRGTVTALALASHVGKFSGLEQS